MTPTPGAKYIRKVTFLDHATDDPKSQPVHVTAELLIDDEPTAVRVNLDEPWSAVGGRMEGTMVSFLVHPDDCHIGRLVESEDNPTRLVYDPHLIGGRPVLTPKAVQWETVHLTEPVGVDGELVHDWVRVTIFAAEVKAIQMRPQAGDYAEDGGMPGELVRCPECHGDGLLHKPDPEALDGLRAAAESEDPA